MWHIIITNGLAKVAVALTVFIGVVSIGVGLALSSFVHSLKSSPQIVATGKVTISLGPINDASSNAYNIAPGDTVTREIDLNSNGASIANSSITLAINVSQSSLLNTDGNNGLQVSLQSCTVPWTRNMSSNPPWSYTCPGSQSSIFLNGSSSMSVTALAAAPATLSSLKSLSINSQDYLTFTLSFPLGAPGDLSKLVACSGISGGTSATENLEGCSTTLDYSLVATQRPATSS